MIQTLHSKNSKGFSLLEVLISITILSFISLAIIAFTDSSIDKSITISAEDAEYLQVETAMSRMEWDVSQAYSPLYFDIPMNPQNLSEEEGQFYNQLADYYQGSANFTMLSYNGLPIPLLRKPEKSSFIFLTTSNRRKIKNSKQSHFAWVKYELQTTPPEDIDNPAIGTSYKLAPPSDSNILVRKFFTTNVYSKEEIEWDNIKSQVLMRKVISLVFEFWNPKTKKWTENLDVIPSGSNILHALRVTIKYYDPDNVEVTTVRIFRTLFPAFEPEDMYKYLKPKNANDPSTQPNNLGPNGALGARPNGEDDEGDGGEDD